MDDDLIACVHNSSTWNLLKLTLIIEAVVDEIIVLKIA